MSGRVGMSSSGVGMSGGWVCLGELCPAGDGYVQGLVGMSG